MKIFVITVMTWLSICGTACDGEEKANLAQVWFTRGQFSEERTEPALMDGRLFVDNNTTLHAFDAETGAALWTKPISVGNKRVFADAGRVFTLGYTLHAFDAATGASLWAYTPVGDTLQYTEGDAANGRVFGGGLYSGSVFALDAATGRMLWRTVLQKPGWTFPAGVKGVREHEGVLYAIANRPYYWNGYIQALVIVALDAATGRELWRYQEGDETTHYMVGSSLSFYGDLVLYGDLAMRKVGAVSRVTHQRVWQYDTPMEWAGPALAPTVEGDRAYVGNGDGRVYAFDAATGRLVWRTARAEGSYASQALCGRYVSASLSTTRVFDKATGARIGQLIDLSKFQESRVVSDGRRFYLAADDGVYAFDCTK